MDGAMPTSRKGKAPKKAAAKGKTPNKSGRFREDTVRSRAFARAILQARPYALSPERLEKLLREASRTVGHLPRQPFQDSWAYLHAMLRLLHAFQLGEYRAIPPKALLSIVAAVAYLVDPNDFIPDEVPFLGFLDDATIIEFAAQKTRSTLDEFMAWELRRLLKK
jgi:uncharacterized membrane protein YkvA (DUF1232 family)